jgi:hypothetical protein
MDKVLSLVIFGTLGASTFFNLPQLFHKKAKPVIWQGDNSNFTAGATGSFNWSGNDYNKNGTYAGNYNLTFWNPNISHPKEFSITFTFVGAKGPNPPSAAPTVATLGLYTAAQMAGLGSGSSTYDTGRFGMYMVYNSSAGRYSSVFFDGTNVHSAYQLVPGSVVKIERSSDNIIRFYDDDALVYQTPSTVTEPLFLGMGGSFSSASTTGRTLDIDNIEVSYFE